MAKTTKTAKTTENKELAQLVEILDPAESKTVLDTINDGFNLVAFLQGLLKFFSRATELEKAAVTTLARANALTVPADKAADAQVQDFIRTARADRKAIDEHWEITALVSRFHRKLMAKRAIGTEALQQAEARATRLHTTYVDNERVRAAEEQRRLQKIEDDKAEAKRQETLAEHEAQAVAAEEASLELSVRERDVVRLVLGGTDWQRACAAAGYRDPVAQAARLKTSTKVQQALEAARTAAAIRTRIEIIKEIQATGDTVEVAPELNKGDRTTWTARVVDLEGLRKAAFTDKTLGIPLSLFVVDQAELNRWARSLEKQIELWPGVVATKNTTVV